MNNQNLRKELTRIFMAGVGRVDPYRLIRDAVGITDEKLVVDSGESKLEFNLAAFNKIQVIGFGKATANMALAMEEILEDRLTEGIISVKYGHSAPLNRIRIIEAGHPIPDEKGLQATRSITDTVSRADAKTLVISLISGGGSALIPSPLSLPEADNGLYLTLAEKQTVTHALLDCGATIHETNIVRKHLSGLKGGRLAEKIFPATCLSLILSDVVGDNLDVIASGATSPDSSTYDDVKGVLDAYRIWDDIPPKARRIIQLGLEKRIPDTPKPGNPVFSNITNCLVGTNTLALEACRREAETLGFDTRIMTSTLVGEAREVAADLYSVACKVQQKLKKGARPICLLYGGETTVTIQGSGKGGRNQELALAFLSQLAATQSNPDGVQLLSGGTDGTDGPTDAAGAFADGVLLKHARIKGLSIDAHLQDNDAYHFFEAANALLKTGPTNTNVCDIQVILIG